LGKIHIFEVNFIKINCQKEVLWGILAFLWGIEIVLEICIISEIKVKKQGCYGEFLHFYGELKLLFRNAIIYSVYLGNWKHAYNKKIK